MGKETKIGMALVSVLMTVFGGVFTMRLNNPAAPTESTFVVEKPPEPPTDKPRFSSSFPRSTSAAPAGAQAPATATDATRTNHPHASIGGRPSDREAQSSRYSADMPPAGTALGPPMAPSAGTTAPTGPAGAPLSATGDRYGPPPGTLTDTTTDAQPMGSRTATIASAEPPPTANVPFASGASLPAAPPFAGGESALPAAPSVPSAPPFGASTASGTSTAPAPPFGASPAATASAPATAMAAPPQYDAFGRDLRQDDPPLSTSGQRVPAAPPVANNPPPAPPATVPVTHPTSRTDLTSAPPPAQTHIPRENTYVVGANDNYYAISEKVYGTGDYAHALEEYNRLRYPAATGLHVGNVIDVPPLDVLKRDHGALIGQTPRRTTPAATPSYGGPSGYAGSGVASPPTYSSPPPAYNSPPPSAAAPNYNAPPAYGAPTGYAPPAGYNNAAGYNNPPAYNPPSYQPYVYPSSTSSASGARVYVVRRGDTLFDIARHELGRASRWSEIYELNRARLGENLDLLAPGMQIVLPEADASRQTRTALPGQYYGR